jgi:hypothetical protein
MEGGNRLSPPGLPWGPVCVNWVTPPRPREARMKNPLMSAPQCRSSSEPVKLTPGIACCRSGIFRLGRRGPRLRSSTEQWPSNLARALHAPYIPSESEPLSLLAVFSLKYQKEIIVSAEHHMCELPDLLGSLSPDLAVFALPERHDNRATGGPKRERI